MKMPFNLNRIIDDFIFLCFFAGNDFLPRIYSFQIRLGSLEKLVDSFKEFLKETDEYLHCRGQINWLAFECMMEKICKLEMNLMNEKLEDYQATLN